MKEAITNAFDGAPSPASAHNLELGGAVPEPHVIFIVGWGRSGSTLLGNALGELQGCVHVGELHDVWAAYAERFECGCGLSLPTCPFWRTVASTHPAVGHALQSGYEVHLAKRRYMRVRYVPRMLLDSRGGRTATSGLDSYWEVTNRLYRSVATAANASTVIDSTKSPAAAALLLRQPARASFLHLVRDPRATGFSWRRHKDSDPSGARQMIRIGYGRNALSWLYWNSFAELIRRQVDPGDWLRVRYEDFVASPEAVMSQIVERFRLPKAGWPFQDHLLNLGTHHTVEGNPSRFKTGPQEIRIDDQWAREMPRIARAVSVALTAPLFLAYGYHKSERPIHRRTPTPLRNDSR